MKNLHKAFITLCVMGLMASCGGRGGSENSEIEAIEKVAEKYVKSLYGGDLQDIQKYMTPKAIDKLRLDRDSEDTKEFWDAVKEENKEASGFNAVETNYSATVKVEVKKGQRVILEKVKMVKNEDGKWLVDDINIK